MKIDRHREELKVYYAFEQELWSSREGVVLELNPFTPLDTPVLCRGKGGSPDAHRAVGPSVIHTGNGFMMWYTGLAMDRNDTDYMSVIHSLCLAESGDGITWHKRNDTIYHGNCKKLLFAAVDYLPEREKFVMAVSFQNGNNGEGGQTTFGLAESADGINWEFPVRPSCAATHFESCAGVKKMDGAYWVVGQGLSPHFMLPSGDPCGRTAFGFYSHDLKQWQLYPHPLFHYPPQEEFLKRNPLNSFQTHVGFTAWPRGRINLGLLGQFWPSGFSETVRFTNGLVYSYDAFHWREPFAREPVLAGENGAWFSNVMQGNTLLNHGDKTYFWFSGGDHRGNTWQAHHDIGLATVRRDGFGAFRARGNTEARLVTREIKLEKGDECLYLNAGIHPGAPVTVTVYDKFMAPLPGMEARPDSGGIMENSGIDLAAVRAQTDTIRLGLTWDRAAEQNELFGFYIGKKVDVRGYLQQWM